MNSKDFEEDLIKTHYLLSECLQKNNVSVATASAALSLCFCALIRELGANEDDVKKVATQMARLSASLIKANIND